MIREPGDCVQAKRTPFATSSGSSISDFETPSSVRPRPIANLPVWANLRQRALKIANKEIH
jgi:hypothetical protein